jgi:hypothetical protein
VIQPTVVRADDRAAFPQAAVARALGVSPQALSEMLKRR